jgi:hypothetical protein
MPLRTWLLAGLLALLTVGCTTKSRVATSSTAVAGSSASAVHAAEAAGADTVAPEPQAAWLIPRTPDMEEALVHDVAELERLRAVPLGNRLTCQQFRRIELAEGLAQRRARDETRPMSAATKRSRAGSDENCRSMISKTSTATAASTPS